MEEKIFIEKLFESSRLSNRPVSYMPELLKAFFGGEINETTFKNEFLKKTRTAKVCLALMTKNEIAACKIIFRNEFILAEAINFAVVENELNGKELKDELKKHIETYNKAAQIERDENG